MKNLRKICVFALVALVLISLLSISALATDASSENATVIDGATEVETEGVADEGKLDMGLKPESFNDRLGYAVQGTVTGILMVFAVLTLLCLILYASKLFFYDIPNKKKEKEIAKKNARVAASIAVEKEKSESEEPVSAPVEAQSDGELAAVITAAIAAMIESGEYKNEFVGGFRVVSFKRSTNSAWNRK